MILLLLVFTTADAFAQRNVSGVFVDENNEPFRSIIVREIGRQHNLYPTFISRDGEFRFKTTKDNTVVRISFAGYPFQDVEIVSDTVLTVRLERTGRKVRGVLVDENNEPIPNIRMWGDHLIDGRSVIIGSVLTDTEGRFSFETRRNDVNLRLSSSDLFYCIPLSISSDTTVMIVGTPFDVSVVVSGTVLDEFNEPVAGAVIRQVGAHRGAITNADGEFELKTPNNSELRVSFFGYYDKRITIASDSVMTIKMQPMRWSH